MGDAPIPIHVWDTTTMDIEIWDCLLGWDIGSTSLTMGHLGFYWVLLLDLYMQVSFHILHVVCLALACFNTLKFVRDHVRVNALDLQLPIFLIYFFFFFFFIL